MPSALGDNGSNARWRKIRQRILKRDGHRCVYCGALARSVDHVIPRSSWPEGVPGVDDPANLVAACVPCNSRKGSRKLDKPVPTMKAKPSREW